MHAGREQVGFVQMNNALLAQYPHLLEQWLPGGRYEGAEYVPLNPIRHDRKAGSFKINWRTGQWSDFATCDRGGDPVSLYAYLNGLSYFDASRELGNADGIVPIKRCAPNLPKAPKVRSDKEKQNAEYALKLWNASFPARNTVVEEYLRARGVTIAVPSSVRLLPGHKHKPSGRLYPVMLSKIQRWPNDDLLAVHRTWLQPDGSGKAPVEPCKMMLGSIQGGAVRLAAAAEQLVICEGIETGLSILHATNLPVWAALSTSGMAGLVLPTLPIASDVIIACDNDAAGRKAASTAAEKWTKEGRKVRIALPPEHKDFNDILMENYA